MIQLLRRRYVITSNSCPVVGPNKMKAKNAANKLGCPRILTPLSKSHLLNTCVSPPPKPVTSCPTITICSAIPPSLNGGNPLVANSFQLSGGYPGSVSLCSINGGTFVTTCYSLSTLNGGNPTSVPQYYINGGLSGSTNVCSINGGRLITTCYPLSTLNGGTPTGNPSYYVNGGSPGGSQVCYISGS